MTIGEDYAKLSKMVAENYTQHCENSLKSQKALDEIEEFCKQNHYCLESEYRWFSDEIQDIINKVKEQ